MLFRFDNGASGTMNMSWFLPSGIPGAVDEIRRYVEAVAEPNFKYAPSLAHDMLGDRNAIGRSLAESARRAVESGAGIVLAVFAPQAVRLFSPEPEVIRYGVLFIRTNVFFLLFNCVNHVLAGALRGRGDAVGPMIIMLSSFVVVRQIYLYLATHYIANTPRIVGLGYPVGWVCCCVIELIYAAIQRRRRNSGASSPQPEKTEQA